jgi:hypothetical protein
MDFHFTLKSNENPELWGKPKACHFTIDTDNSRAPQEEPKAGLVIGTFNTQEVRSPTHPVLKTSRAITLLHPYLEPPRVLFAFSELDLPSKPNIRVRTYHSEITTHKFQANLEGWDDSIPRIIGVNWLEIPAGEPDFQCGTFNTAEDRSAEVKTLNTRAVTFAEPFRTPPEGGGVAKRA